MANATTCKFAKVKLEQVLGTTNTLGTSLKISFRCILHSLTDIFQSVLCGGPYSNVVFWEAVLLRRIHRYTIGDIRSKCPILRQVINYRGNVPQVRRRTCILFSICKNVNKK